VQAQPEASFSKRDLRYWKERIFQADPTTRGGNRYEGPNWAVYIQHRGRRHKWSLGKPNREAAAAIAKDIFLSLQAKGWDAYDSAIPAQAGREKRNVPLGVYRRGKSQGDLDAKPLKATARPSEQSLRCLRDRRRKRKFDASFGPVSLNRSVPTLGLKRQKDVFGYCGSGFPVRFSQAPFVPAPAVLDVNRPVRPFVPVAARV